MSRIAVAGATGQVGREVVEVLRAGGPGPGPGRTGAMDLVDLAVRTLAARGSQTRVRPSSRGPSEGSTAGAVLLPGDGARLGTTSFRDWLARRTGDPRDS